jgi:hypothetical protein
MAGAPLNYAYVPYLEDHLKDAGKWKGASNPQSGDLVLFDWNGAGQEGVWRRTRPMSDVVGFGNP